MPAGKVRRRLIWLPSVTEKNDLNRWLFDGCATFLARFFFIYVFDGCAASSPYAGSAGHRPVGKLSMRPLSATPHFLFLPLSSSSLSPILSLFSLRPRSLHPPFHGCAASSPYAGSAGHRPVGKLSMRPLSATPHFLFLPLSSSSLSPILSLFSLRPRSLHPPFHGCAASSPYAGSAGHRPVGKLSIPPLPATTLFFPSSPSPILPLFLSPFPQHPQPFPLPSQNSLLFKIF